ncbi:hypothetical protein MOE88_21500, partial [Bacillus spizizenii]|nr:hypothetical protein [Bacillus spizizenii]
MQDNEEDTELFGEREGRVDSLLDTLYNLSEEKEAF